jgi:DNA polymerase III epsilon subunit family exonuclease
MGHPSPKTALTSLEFVAFDTETTGLSPVAARLVELSGVKFRLDGSEVSTFSQLIDPESNIPADATAIHGITDQMVDGQPVVKVVIPQFLDWIGGCEVVLLAHNAPFDLGFLEIALARLKLCIPENPILDTLVLARALVPEAPNYQLRTLVEYLELESGGYHRALADSNHARHLLVKLMSMHPDIVTWGHLQEVADMLSFTDVVEEGFEQLKSMPIGFEWIRDAIDDQTPIRILYRNGRISARTVTPQSVHCWRGNVYLNAFCHMFHAERTFRLDRIIEFELLEKT